jgi:hypothetical protein
MATRTPFITVLILALGVAACAQSPTATTAPPDVQVTEAATPAPDATTAPPTPTTGPVIGVQGVTTIVQLTPTEGVGLHPLFEWEAVPGAVLYSLTLHTADDRPYWAWEGTETSIYLGGAVQLADDSVGPRLYEPMTWTVFAFDADGMIVGSSPARPVAP